MAGFILECMAGFVGIRIHHDDLAFRKCGRETFFHPILEGRRVHRFVEHLLRDEAGKAQTGYQRDGLVMAMRNADAKPLALSAASAFAR